MPSNIETEHANLYSNEREARWGMADVGEEKAIIEVCKALSSKFSISPNLVTFERYDELWFNMYDIKKTENEWVKGVSDYLVKIKIDKEKYLLIEIKLKAQEFRKTKSGGKTANGSNISNYGCTSFYLDVVPVYKNMNDFVDKTKIKSSSFIVAFIKDDLSEINLISLAKIRNLISKGWKKDLNTIVEICEYGEGYGQVAFLIPKLATININNITKDSLEKVMADEYPNPRI